MIPKKSSPEPTKLTFGSAARACKTNRVRQESGPDGGGPASGPSGGETGIEMPEMTPGRKDLGALLQGFGESARQGRMGDQPADGCVFAENSHVLLAVRLQPHGHPAPGSDDA